MALSIVGTGLGLLITTVTFFLKFIVNAKAKVFAQNVIKLGEVIIPYIEQAEKFTGYSGEEKKEYVMTKANQYAIINGIKFDASAVSLKIEELVQLSKQINSRQQT